MIDVTLINEGLSIEITPKGEEGDKGPAGDPGELTVIDGRITANANAIRTKANKGVSYTKAEDNALLNRKLNVGESYTKVEANSLLNRKLNIADLPPEYDEAALARRVTANDEAITANTRDIITSDADITANSNAIETLATLVADIPENASAAPVLLVGFTALLAADRSNAQTVYTQADTQTTDIAAETAEYIEVDVDAPAEGLESTHFTIISNQLIQISEIQAVAGAQLFTEDDELHDPVLIIDDDAARHYVYQSVDQIDSSGRTTWRITFTEAGGLLDKDEARITSNTAAIEANTVLASGNVLHHTVVINDSFTLGGEWSHPKFDNASVFTFTFPDAQTALQAAELLSMSAIAPLNSPKTAARLVVKIQRLDGNRIKVFLEGQMSAAASSSGNSNIQFWQTTRQGKVTRVVGGSYLEDVQSLEVAGPADIATLVNADTAIKLLVTANTNAIANSAGGYNDEALSERVTANADAIAAIPDVATAISGKAEISNTYMRGYIDTQLDGKLASDLTGFDADTTDRQKAAFIEFLELTDAAGFDEEALRLLITANTDALAATYTQTQINFQNTGIMNSVALKANTADVYTRDVIYTRPVIDNALAMKADKRNTFTQTDINNKLDRKLDIADLPISPIITSKANVADTYSRGQADSLLDQKANLVDTYNPFTIDAKLDRKLDTTSGAVGTDNLANSSITSRKIQNGTISHDDLASDSIFADNIANGQVQTHHLALGAVTNDHILDRTIASSKLADGVIPDITGKLDKDWTNLTDLELSHLGSRTRPLWGLLSSRETTTEFFLKANVSETYSRTVIDDKLDLKLDITALPDAYNDATLQNRTLANTAAIATKLEDDLSNLADDLTTSEQETARTKLAAGEVITTAMVSPTANEIVLSNPFSTAQARVYNNRYRFTAPSNFTEADAIEYNNLVGNYVVFSDRNDPSVLPDSPPFLIISVEADFGVAITGDDGGERVDITFDPIAADEFVTGRLYLFGRFLEGVGSSINRIYGGDLDEATRTLTVPSAHDITMLADMIASNATLSSVPTDLTEAQKDTLADKLGLASSRLKYNSPIFTQAQGASSATPFAVTRNTVYLYGNASVASEGDIIESIVLPANTAIGDRVEFKIIGNTVSTSSDLKVRAHTTDSSVINGVLHEVANPVLFSPQNHGGWSFEYTGPDGLGWVALSTVGRQ